MLNKIFDDILALFDGFITVFKHALKPRVTLEYPEIKQELDDNFRGKHQFCIDKCLGCGICQKVCPANAINIIKNDNKVVEYVIDYSKCIFCGNCAEYCTKNAISMGKDYELASDNKNDLVVSFKKEVNDD